MPACSSEAQRERARCRRAPARSGSSARTAGRNAYEQLLALRAKYPDSNEVRIEQQQLASAFLERTRTALAAGDVDTARAFLSRVDTLVPNMTATKSLQTQLAAAQQERNFATNIVQAKTLKLVREVRAGLSARSGAAGI